MSGRLKKILWLLPIPILLVAVTTVPSGGWKMYNSARQVVIEFFDSGDATFTGDVTANAFIGDGSGLTGVSGGTGHTIKEEGTPLTTRAGLNFIGPTVTATDNSGTSSTDVTINAVAGPSSSTDNTLPRFDSTTGKIIQGSGVAIDDSNNMSGIAALTAGSLDLTTLLTVGEGGTGASSFTDAGVLIGNGTGVVQSTGAGTAGQVLTSNGVGVDPTFQSFPGGGDALTTQPLSQFASTTSLQLSNLLSNETGSGAAVFGTSPTLVTPNLGTPSNLVLTNATGLPVAGGGTGASTFTDAGVLIGNSTGAIQSTGAGTAGQVLTSNGAGVDPTFQTPSAGSGDLVGPSSATDNAIARFDGTTGKLVQNSAVTIADTSGNIATSGTVDGRDLSTDGTKLDGIESGATADQTDSEIETAYNNQVAVVTQAEAEAGSLTTVKRWTPQRVSQAIAALGGGDPTYGSNAGAADNSMYIDSAGSVGIGTMSPGEEVHIYSETSAPRLELQYYNPPPGDVTAYPGTFTGTTPGTSPTWSSPSNAGADDGSNTSITMIGGTSADGQTLKGVCSTPFSIPSTATVDGVKVEVEGQMGNSNVAELHAYLVRGGTIDTGVDRSTGATWANSMAVHTYGSNIDDWGGITPTEVNDPGFGFAFQVHFTDNTSVSIDYIRITIYYTTDSGDYTWTTGVDTLDGAWTLRALSTDQLRISYLTGDSEFTGDVTAPAFIGDGSGLTGISKITALTGDVTASGSGSVSATIANGAVDIAHLSATGTPSSSTYLRGDNTWATVSGGSGTVTSVGLSGGDGINVSGSPITTSGSFTLSVNSADFYNNLYSDAAGVTATKDDIILIADYSNSYALRQANLSDLMMSVASTDNRIPKFVNLTGQVEVSGISIDDSDNIVMPSGSTVDGVDVSTLVSNATHTGEVTGSTALTLDKTAITGKTTAGPATGDYLLFSDVSDSDNLKKDTIANILALISGLTDSQISDTLTASNLVGSGSTSNAVDLPTAEVNGTLPIANGGTGATTLAGASIPTYTSTNTFSNKRITPRAFSETSNTTPSYNIDSYDVHSITALAGNITSVTWSGTPTIGETYRLYITDNGVAKTLVWGTASSGPATLPTTTVAGKTLHVLMQYDGTVWRCMATGSNP